MAIGPTSQKDQIKVGVGILAIAAAVAYWYFVFAPKSQDLAALKTHVATLDQSNQRAKAELAKGSVNDLREQARLYQRNLQLMRQLVPTSNEVPALLEQVSTAARKVGLDIATVQPEPVISGDQFDTYRYKLTISGSYHDVAEFLANVGSLTRIIAPVNLKLNPLADQRLAARRTKGEAALNAEFEIQTYVAKAGTPADRTGQKSETKS
jgi:type IV pilus assembly protein PilO